VQLYLIRHGQSENNACPEHMRVEDAELTELGQQQARHLAPWIATLELDRLFCSPFRRTLQTAWPLMQQAGLEVEVKIPLHEVGGCVAGPGGDDLVGRPGITGDELREDFPGYQVPASIDENGWWKSQPNETDAQLHKRVEDLFQSTVEEFADSDQKIGFMMHADITHHLLSVVARVTGDRLARVLYNTAVTRLTIGRDSLVMDIYNSISHLPMSMASR
jgi:2,3-bisphosphoglycerate-dependent phosphoglycerate mutase